MSKRLTLPSYQIEMWSHIAHFQKVVLLFLMLLHIVVTPGTNGQLLENEHLIQLPGAILHKGTTRGQQQLNMEN